MRRKKVQSQTTKKSLPKKRTEEIKKSTVISTMSNETKSRWDKVVGVKGKIVRFKESDCEKRKELLTKQNHRLLYVGVDGNDLYFYYEILD